MDDTTTRKLRIAGLGHNLNLELSPCTTIKSLKLEVESRTNIPAIYQKLLARGSKLDSDEATLDESDLKDRTRVMLLHNEIYAVEKEGFEALSVLNKEIDDLAAKIEITEYVTRICCKLDSIDTKGSDYLRSLRKDLIAKAEGLDNSSSNTTRMADNDTS